jgi:hypothetical protein
MWTAILFLMLWSYAAKKGGGWALLIFLVALPVVYILDR